MPMSFDDDVDSLSPAEMRAEIRRLRKHVSKLQLACMKVLDDWWPLVYDRTCRDTVKKQWDEVANAISDS